VDYLVPNIAAGDGRGRPHGTAMTRYYRAKGYPPGTWLGSGLAGAGGAGRVGEMVSETQLRTLFEGACSPFDRQSLGKAPARYPTRAERIELRIGKLSPTMPDAVRGHEKLPIGGHETAH
jgi:hypothetical protein